MFANISRQSGSVSPSCHPLPLAIVVSIFLIGTIHELFIAFCCNNNNLLVYNVTLMKDDSVFRATILS